MPGQHAVTTLPVTVLPTVYSEIALAEDGAGEATCLVTEFVQLPHIGPAIGRITGVAKRTAE
jgi:hypothetical protein